MTVLRARSSGGRAPGEFTNGTKPTAASKKTKERMSNEEEEDSPTAWDERFQIVLLLLLYTAQGLPMGLIFGSLPFLLKANANVTFADLGVFSLCSMPYALKLLIAPAVDGGRPPLAHLGRRRGWIVPPLVLAAALLALCADAIENSVQLGRVRSLTLLCTIIIALTAVQDVAVDGWSLELLSPANVAYASTCQSLGTSLGYIATFTLFLALNDPAFCTTYLWPLLQSARTDAALSIAAATRAVAAVFFVVSAAVAFAPPRVPRADGRAYAVKKSGSLVDEEAHVRVHRDALPVPSVTAAYRALGRLLRLPPVQSLVTALLLAKVGFSAHDSATALKLIDLGFPKETLASIALLQAPIQLLGTVIVGRWAAQGAPEVPYLVGYVLRLLFSLGGPMLVRGVAATGGAVSPRLYACLVVLSIAYGLAADCLMFVSIGAFFLRITAASTAIGGSYLTLLYAAQNMGGMWHRAITLSLVERFTTYKNCELSEHVKTCPIDVDGYFVLSAVLAVVGLAVGVLQYRTMRRLARLPLEAWKPTPA